uniref:Uncharacterized protein n=1 Tax=Mycena chlorophos TaxID=658473 RepID=A0ABQ0LC71_MYCCL|nr:predicted protein [Mycena chlorophos]
MAMVVSPCKLVPAIHNMRDTSFASGIPIPPSLAYPSHRLLPLLEPQRLQPSTATCFSGSRMHFQIRKVQMRGTVVDISRQPLTQVRCRVAEHFWDTVLRVYSAVRATLVALVVSADVPVPLHDWSRNWGG